MQADAITHYIKGQRANGAAGADARYGDVFDPATGEIARRVVLATEADADLAVAAAKAAFPRMVGDDAVAPRPRHVQVQGSDGTACG